MITTVGELRAPLDEVDDDVELRVAIQRRGDIMTATQIREVAAARRTIAAAERRYQSTVTTTYRRLSYDEWRAAASAAAAVYRRDTDAAYDVLLSAEAS
jgi:hypothetical protein